MFGTRRFHSVIGLALLVCALPPAQGWGAKPVGIVSVVDGVVRVERNGNPLPCLLYGHLYEGDRLEVAKGGRVQVRFSESGQVERLGSPGIWSVEAAGFAPREGVEIATPSSDSGRRLVAGSVPALNGASLQGMVTFRSVNRDVQIRPVDGSLVDGGKIKFNWPMAEGAKFYLITIRPESQEFPNEVDANQVVFVGRSGSHQATLDDRSEFQPGVRYYWSVDVEKQDGSVTKGIAAGNYLVASAAQRDFIAEYSKIVDEETDASILSLTALALYSLGAKDEAITAYEVLVREDTGNPLFQIALGSLYNEVGWHDSGKLAHDRAKLLGYDATAYRDALLAERRSAGTFGSGRLDEYIDETIGKLEDNTTAWNTFVPEFVEPASRGRIDRSQRYALLQAVRSIRGTNQERGPDGAVAVFRLEQALMGIDRVTFVRDAESDRWFLRF